MRNKKIREYGKAFVEAWEQYWREQGYKINYSTGLLERIENEK